ncbi:cyanoexosortase A [Merismopedia glauca]|uniref:Cyanoexosortase A n=1 Tax=Merismopedia glauca CCAP 1448/3 TaxID=1296344 RepID=A0A2T1C9I1_9CYAN|nr:cyanoexosortase A [Merismopedia glauca]PSB04818.1 cyanoexosortase A [Merismopedia glauca CCAP 1448/3]
MVNIDFSLSRQPQFWLLAIASGLVAIHLTIVGKVETGDLFGISLIYWLAVGSLIWEKRATLVWRNDLSACILGSFLLLIVLFKSILPAVDSKFLYTAPLLSGLGLALIASGFHQLKQYWQELLILFCLVINKITIAFLGSINLAEYTAKFSTLLLWYSGFQVGREGVNIILPNQVIEVYTACSGVEAIAQMEALALLFIIMFPLSLTKKIIVPLIAMVIGFVVNCIRVVIMSLLAANSQQEAFDYWHEGDGSLVFSLIAALVFAGFCYLLLRSENTQESDSASLS